MRKRLPLLVFAIFNIVIANAQAYNFSDSWAEEGFNITAQDQQSVSLTYSIREFTLDDLEIRGEAMKLVRLPGHFLPGDEGAPDLPGSGRYIALPQGATPVLHIKSMRKEVIRGVNISPSPRLPKDTERGPLEYNKNMAVYSRDAFYPAEPFKLSELTRVRGVDAVILGITPFQYNPVTKELIVYRDVEIEVEFEGGNGTFGEDRLRSRWWDPLLDDIFVNYSQLPAAPSPSLPPTGGEGVRVGAAGNRATGYEYLIICPNDPVFISWADSIRIFRNMQGIYTGVVTLADIGGNTVPDIENYVNNAYETWDIPPAAILLLGDYGTFGSTVNSPIWDSYCVSDHIYADVNGDDEEEIVFARMTARNNAELEVMIRKVMDYESNPPMSPDYYNHPITALGWQTERWFQICSEVVGGYFRTVQGKDPVRVNEVYEGNPDTDPWSTAQNTATVLGVFGPDGLGYIPATPSELGAWTGGTPAKVNEALNAGSFLIQHRDHGFENGWGEPAYTSSDIPGLTNTDLSFIFSINCLTGKYNYGQECFAEKFHRYTYNGQPAGALGLLAASEVSYSFVNDVYVWGVFDNLFPDFMPEYGSTPESRGLYPAFGNAAGKFFLKYSSWPYNTSNKEVTYNLFHMHGDAFTCLYSEVPQDLTIQHSPVQLAGSPAFSIRADEGSIIAISVDGEIIGLADGTGASADVPILPQNPPTFIDVVVTKQNFLRYHTKVQVIPPNGPFVITDSYMVSDPSGNNNGKLDYGETVAIDIILKNLGNETAENVNVSIITEDEYATVIDGSADAGTIQPGQTSEVNGAFSVSVTGDVPNGHVIIFNMQASSPDTTWNSAFIIKAFAPVLEYVDFSVSDVNGNNNGRLDAGETADVTVSVKNKGGADAYGIYGMLSSEDPFIQIVSDSVMFGDIPQNTTLSQTFSVSSLVITPPGHQADFTLQFTGDLGISTEGSFTIQVGLFPILVLDLDENHNSGSLMKDAIDDWLIFAEYKEEIPADLSQYRTIFMCLGTYSQNHVLTSPEAAPFIYFLNDGGNLYIEGADTWYYDQEYNPTSLHPMFNIEGLLDGTDDLGYLAGVAGTFTEGMNFNYNGDNSYIDHIAPIEPAFKFFSNTTPNYDVAVAYDAGNYKTIGTTFEFGGLLNSQGNTRKNLMLKYMTFFGMNPIAEAPPAPTGDITICPNTGACVYTTQSVASATYYIWEVVPPEAGIVDGWDTEVTVNWDPGFVGAAKLKVCGMNESGLGPVSDELEIKVSALPTAEMAFSATTICAGDTTYASIDLTGLSPWNLVISVGGNEITMTPNKPDMDDIPLSATEDIEVQIVSLSDGTGCVTTDFAPIQITVDPLPYSPELPTGPQNVDLFAGTQSVYTTAGGDNAISYAWILEPTEAGNMTISENGLECTVDWAAAFTGQAQLKVNGINDCGEGEFSEMLAVTVANTFGLGENESGLGIAIYPNPNDGNFSIELSAETPTKAKFRLLTATGEPVWGPVDIEINRRLTYPVSQASLSNGIYLIQFETNKGISNRKIIIKN